MTPSALSCTDLLVVALLALLSGLPQFGISLTGLGQNGELLQQAPLTRSLLLDKLLPEEASLSPPDDSGLPRLLAAPPSSSRLGFSNSAAETSGTTKPSPWLLDLTLRLYRHHSSYV